MLNPIGQRTESTAESLTPESIAAFLKAFHFDREPIAPIRGLSLSPLSRSNPISISWSTVQSCPRSNTSENLIIFLSEESPKSLSHHHGDFQLH